MMHLTDELREYAQSLFKTKPYRNPLTDIADNIDKDVNKLMIKKYKLEESHERLFSKTLNLEDENKQLRELLQDTFIQTDQYCDKHGIEYADRANAFYKANDDIDRRLRELGIEVD